MTGEFVILRRVDGHPGCDNHQYSPYVFSCSLTRRQQHRKQCKTLNAWEAQKPKTLDDRPSTATATVAATTKKKVSSDNKFLDETLKQILASKYSDNGTLQNTVDIKSMLNAPTAGPTMGCDISCLFNMDIIRENKAPGWTQDEKGRCSFFINDEKTLQLQANEKEDYLHSAGGCKPAVGHKVSLLGNLPVGMCRLSGRIVMAFRLPSDSDLKRLKRSSNPSMLYDNPCSRGGQCGKDCGLTCTGKRSEILRRFGCLHSQQVRCTLRLATEYKNTDALTSFFGVSKWYDAILRCNDNYTNMWELARIEPHKRER